MCQNDISQTFLKLIIFTAFRQDGGYGLKNQVQSLAVNCGWIWNVRNIL